ncbi:MAG: AgmX/PglI C-terminal domain-containing protein [Myxococcota bacterium]
MVTPLFPMALLLAACSHEAPTPSAPLDQARPPSAPAGAISGAPILETPVILGGISNANVESALTSAVFAGCNQAGRPGKVLVRFRLTADGAVEDVELRSTTLRHPQTESCVMDNLRTVRFPALTSGDKAIVTWPITL